MNKLQPGQTTYCQWGGLNIRIDMHTDGVSITVDHHPTLNRAFTNLHQGRAYLAFLRDKANAGKPVWLIEAGAGALTSTAAIVDDAEQALIDSINATLDKAQAPEVEIAARLKAEVDAIVADADPNWRAKLRAQVIEAADRKNRLHDYSRTRVCRKPPTTAQLDLIRNHRGGEVRVRDGQPWTMLKGIVDRDLGTPVYGLRKKIAAVRLNTRGLNIAAEQAGVKA